MNAPDPRPHLGLRPVVNVSGTMTSLGASIVVPEAIAALADERPAVVEGREQAEFEAALKASGVKARQIGEVEGLAAIIVDHQGNIIAHPDANKGLQHERLASDPQQRPLLILLAQLL